MRKKIAMVLVLLMLISCMNVWADTDDSSVSENIETTKVTADNTDPSETENHTIENNSASLENETNETVSVKNGEEFSTEETLENLEEASSGESMEGLTQESEKKDKESEAEETLPLSDENQEEDDNKSTPKEQPETFLSEDDVIYNVSFPTNIRAYLDPDNLSGRGQVFSERYEIENFGNTDVTIKIKSIEVYSMLDEDSYEFLETSETEMAEGFFQNQKINVDMIWENKDKTYEKVLHVEEGILDECVIKLKAAQDNKESVGYFYFTGTMNASPYINWESADISVTFHYEILSPIDMEEEYLEKKIQEEDILQTDSIVDKEINSINEKKGMETEIEESKTEKENPEIKETEKGEVESETTKETETVEEESTLEETKETEIREEELTSKAEKEIESEEESMPEATKETEVRRDEPITEASKETETREEKSISEASIETEPGEEELTSEGVGEIEEKEGESVPEDYESHSNE